MSVDATLGEPFEKLSIFYPMWNEEEYVERAVLLAIAHGLPPMGRETLDALARAQGSRPTVAKVRAAIERLRRAGLLVKAGSGPTAVDDPLFAEYLLGKSLDQLN